MLRRLLPQALLKLLAIRYPIDLETPIPESDSRPCLFLPNHPALIDPVICSALLYERFQPSPLVDETQASSPLLRTIFNQVGAVYIPSIREAGSSAVVAVQTGLQRVTDALQQGQNVLLYPAGQLMRSSKEDLRANSGVSRILENFSPDQQLPRVILVRTVGLYGSRFSRATGLPNFIAGAISGISDALANGIFFLPKRRVRVAFEELDTAQLLTLTKDELNRQLEAFYNAGEQPAVFISTRFWKPAEIPQLPVAQATIPTADIRMPEQHLQEVLQILTAAAGTPVTATDRQLSLTSDLAIDSLALVSVVTQLEQHFGVTASNLEGFQTVQDLLNFAAGVQCASSTLRKPSSQWFNTTAFTTHRLPPTETVQEAVLHCLKNNSKMCLFADQLSGELSRKKVLIGACLLATKFREIPEERVGLLLPTSVGGAIAYLALLFAKKVPVIINWTVGSAQLETALQSVGVRTVVSSTVFCDRLTTLGSVRSSQVAEKMLYLEEIRASFSKFSRLQAYLASIWISAAEFADAPKQAVILFTSGSEAAPKAVPLTHQNVLTNMAAVLQALKLPASSSLLGILPFFHSLGLLGTLLLPLCTGIRTVYHTNPTESRVLAEIIPLYRPSLLLSTPTFLQGILQAAPEIEETLCSLQYILSGAEACPEAVQRLLREKLPGVAFLEGYGITECSPVISLNVPGDEQLRPTPTVGKPLNNLSYVLLHPETSETLQVLEGQQGILAVAGDSIFDGYLNTDAKPFKQIFGKQFYVTGDIVRVNQGYLQLLGRQKRFVKIGGEMISLPAIEATLLRCLPETTLAVIATTGDRPALIAVVNTDRTVQELNASLLSAGLSPLHKLSAVRVVAELPVLGTGKTDYKQLEALFTAS